MAARSSAGLRKTYGDEPVVLQDDRLTIPESVRDPQSLFPIEHHSAKVVIDRMALPESQSVLRDHVQLSAKHRKGFAVHRVSVACSMDVRTSLVDLRVNSKGCGVDGFLAFYHLSIFIDEDEVGDFNLGEMCGEWV